MRTALALAVVCALAACKGAPAPSGPHPTAATADAGVDAPPKDRLPEAVERVVHLYEAIAALPPEPDCAKARAAIVALRTPVDGDLAVIRTARAERPAEVEALWVAQQARLTAAWPGLQRSCPIAVDELDPTEAP